MASRQGDERYRRNLGIVTMARGNITDKWHRVCLGCGKRHHINALKQMDGNECCPGKGFSRDKSKIES